MKQTRMLDHESCVNFRRLGGLLTVSAPRCPSSPIAEIPVRVGHCAAGRSGAQCPTCGRFHESACIGDEVRCCGRLLRLGPVVFVLPTGPACRDYAPRCS